IHIQQVVIGKFLAMQFLEHGLKVSKEIPLLVGVFPIAELLALGLADLQGGLPVVLVKIVEDSRIVMGGDLEGLGGKALAVLQGSVPLALGEDVKEFIIIFPGGNTEYVL